MNAVANLNGGEASPEPSDEQETLTGDPFVCSLAVDMFHTQIECDCETMSPGKLAHQI